MPEDLRMSLQIQQIFLLAARLLLATVFVVSAIAKLADRRGLRTAMSEFGVPDVLARPAGLLLPLVELAVALALLPAGSAWWAAVGALALLFVFTAAVVSSIARGRRPGCHCFGALSSKPVSWGTVARNLALAAVAAVVVSAGPDDVGPSVVAWLSRLTLADGIVLVAGAVILSLITVETWMLAHVLRQNGRLLLRLDAVEADLANRGPARAAPGLPAAPGPPAAGLPSGSLAPAFRLYTLDDIPRTLSDLLLPGKRVALVFIDPGCNSCSALLPELDLWQRTHQTGVTLVLISRGSVAANRRQLAGNGFDHVLLDQNDATSRAYQAYGTPSMVIISADGTIASSVARGAQAIRAGMTGFSTDPQSTSRSAGAGSNGHDHRSGNAAVTPRALAIGQLVPLLRLPDLSGAITGLGALDGQETLVLFWSPACGFCQQMLGELKRWETARAQGAPQLLVVSAGTREANLALGLAAPILLDGTFSAGAAFGARGTPSAILVDKQGRVSSELAVGATAVLALAERVPDPSRTPVSGAALAGGE
jgi:peroxiredoxin/uncharacterized membrane protein YphA (DoxX/SURF4 family)